MQLRAAFVSHPAKYRQGKKFHCERPWYLRHVHT